MSIENNLGSPVHLEISATNPNAEAFLIYPNGSTTAITLGSTQLLLITDLLLGVTSTTAFLIAAATDAAGRRIIGGSLVDKGGVTHHFETPYACPVGLTPKLTAAAGGATVCTMQARLVDA